MTQMFSRRDFTHEVAHFCTLGLYITKNKYELTLPTEFCRFPVKIMAAYEALKKTKNHWPLGPVENKLWWPELARQPQKGMRTSGHIASQCQGLLSNTGNDRRELSIVKLFPRSTSLLKLFVEFLASG